VGVSHADEGFITSEELALADVKGTVTNHVKTMNKDATLKEIYGIYRNEANRKNVEVFWSAMVDGKVEQSSTTILRFNSGKWFNADIGEFLKK
jgi:hypothetical protein